MPDFIELEQEFFAHDLQSADFAGVLLLGQVDLTVATLADLRENLEVAMPQPGAPLPQVCALATKILVQNLVVLLFRCIGRGGELRLERGETVLSVVDVGEKVIVIVQEVWDRQCLETLIEGKLAYTAESHWPIASPKASEVSQCPLEKGRAVHSCQRNRRG